MASGAASADAAAIARGLASLDAVAAEFTDATGGVAGVVAATMRFRYGKVCRSAIRSTGYSLMTAPFWAMRSARARFSGG